MPIGNASTTSPSRFFASGTRPIPKRQKKTIIRIAPNIRRVDNRIEARSLGPNGKLKTKMFPADTSVDTVQAWIDYMRYAHSAQPKVPPHRASLPRSTDGWCYLYFIQQGKAVKIGRASDVARRLEELQTASSVPLVLLAAVACHASLEREYLKRFAPYRLSGEWFAYGGEIRHVVNRLRDGVNPVELLFSWDAFVVPVDQGA